MIIISPKLVSKGSACGSVGGVVASVTRGPQFKSRHWRNFIKIIFSVEKTKVKKKRSRRAYT